MKHGELHVGSTDRADTAHPVSRRGTSTSDTPTPAGSEPLGSASAIQPVDPQRLRTWLIISDGCALVVAMALAVTVQGWVRPVHWSIRSQEIRLAVASLPFWLTAMGLNRLFAARALVRRSEEFRRLISTNLFGVGFIVAVGFAAQFKALSRLWVALVFICTTTVLMVTRTIARHVFAWMREQGYCSRPVVIVGTGVDALSVLHTTLRHPELGYKVVGLTGDDIGERGGGVRVLGSIDDTLNVIEDTGAIGAILSVPSLDPRDVNVLTRQITKAGYHVTLSPALQDIDVTRARPQELDGRLMIYVEPTGSAWHRTCKRAFDIVVSAVGLLIAAPIIGIAALAIKLTSPGPVIFSQVRIGRHGKEFRILKLRTMVADAEDRLAELLEQNEADGPLFKMSRDPRITKVGRLLRKTSIDELPQLWNVLRGEMSIVGPRPALPREMAQWSPELHERLQVLPGITGMWQVSGRSDTDFEHYQRLDLYYVDNWSLMRDLSIVARTVGVVMFGKGAH